MNKNRNIPIKNVYYMLAYAFQALERWEDVESETEAFDSIQNLFAAILSNGLGRLIKRGLYREYINQKEDLAVIRGKVELPGTIRNRITRKTRISCEFDELSDDNLLNQILKSTVLVLLRHADVGNKYKDELKRELLYFSNVSEIELSGIRWTELRFERNNASYRVLITICQLVSEGLLLTEESGHYRLANFFDGMHMSKLYEKFILEYYRREHRELRASAAKIPWVLDDGIGTLLPEMHSDVTLQNKKGNQVLILDAKFYTHTMQEQFQVVSNRSNNLYQIFTYVKNREFAFGDEPHVVSGMVLYARTNEVVQPDQTYQMSGNEICVRTLDLNTDFEKIREQLDQIAWKYVGNSA